MVSCVVAAQRKQSVLASCLPAAAPAVLPRLSPLSSHPTPTPSSFPAGERAEWVIDPSFATAFVVADPTPRFAHILSAVPQLVVAPLPRLLRALLVLANELERCFKARGVPLPPWRSADALTTRYEAPAPTRAAPPSAAARQNARQHAQTESVQLKLLRMGLGLGLDEQQGSAEQQGVTPHSPLAPASSSGSDTGEAAGESPESVIQVRLGGWM